MATATSEWLSKRGGDFRIGADGVTWLVILNNEPQYMLTPVPAGGKHACQVLQTNNGKRLDKGGTHSTPDEAIASGLEDLRQALGW